LAPLFPAFLGHLHTAISIPHAGNGFTRDSRDIGHSALGIPDARNDQKRRLQAMNAEFSDDPHAMIEGEPFAGRAHGVIGETPN
jgi:hypothetical protein